MTKSRVIDYLLKKYGNSVLDAEDVEILVEQCASTYLNRTFPFVSVKDENKVDFSWVLRASISVLERGDIDVTQLTEVGLSQTIGASLMTELVPCAGVPKDESESDT